MPPAATSAQALSNLQGFQKSEMSPQAAMDQSNQQMGVPQAQQQVTGLRGAINNTTNLLNQVAPSVYGRTANSLVTDAQATHMISNEQQPLNTQLNKEQTDYTNANSDYQNALSQSEARANAILSGQQNQESYLQNIYNDLAQKEQSDAQMAQQQRQFDATLAESRAARAAAGSSVASPSLGGFLGAGGNLPSGASSQPPAGFARGTDPNAAIKQLFTGYNPSADKYYTEQVVIPAISRLLQMNNPHQSSDVINGAAQHLVYGYRKQAFGQ